MNIFYSIMTFISAVTTSDGPDLEEVADKINSLLGSIWTVCASIAGGLLVIYGFIVAGMYVTSLGDETKKKKAQTAVIGIGKGVAVGILIVALSGGVISALVKWGGVSF